MTRLIIVTVLLAVVAVVVFWRGRSASPQRTVRVTARAGLARGSSVAVVEVDGRRFLLGAAGNAVNILAELGAAPAADAVEAAGVADEPVAAPATVTFAAPVAVQPSDVVVSPAALQPAGAAAAAALGPIERLKSMTVRTPMPARRALRSEL